MQCLLLGHPVYSVFIFMFYVDCYTYSNGSAVETVGKMRHDYHPQFSVAGSCMFDSIPCMYCDIAVVCHDTDSKIGECALVTTVYGPTQQYFYAVGNKFND